MNIYVITTYVVTDNREVDRVDSMQLFVSQSDAIASINSMGDDKKYFTIKTVELIA